ncbi:hypothetical protein FHS59_004274 [Algoriphagus iocasae]|uniref:Uncharacterized protein n=1 Tax=Algoriphagus iocasae TaxID=1836499 RepID=A0A841N106_9BACT|nr:hypothetical protein [Algoriphagus iocasae]MBB6328618.1 hypothetical protein [Algoriphagus iocasae]
MKKNPLILWSIAFIIFVSSCSEKTEVITQEEKNYEWVLIDSLDLNFLGNPMLSDVSKDGETLLFYDYTSKQILVVDKEGTINSSFSKEEDTPDSYGNLLERPGFFKSNQLTAFGRNGLFFYNLEGELIKKIPHPETLGATGSINHAGKSTETITLQGKEYILTKSVRTRNTFPGEQLFYDSYRAIELVDKDSETMTEMIPFEEGSLFLNGKGYHPSDYTAAYEAYDGKLYFVHGGDPKLFSYQISPEEATLDTIIQLDIPNFFSPEGKDRAEFQKGTVTIYGGTAAVRNIHVIDNLLLLDFYSGQDPIKAEEAESLWAGGNEEEARALYKKLEDDTPKGTILYSLPDLKYLGMVPPPENTGGRSYASANGFAWFQKLPDPDVEEDFLRIYKMKLVEK